MILCGSYARGVTCATCLSDARTRVLTGSERRDQGRSLKVDEGSRRAARGGLDHAQALAIRGRRESRCIKTAVRRRLLGGDRLLAVSRHQQEVHALGGIPRQWSVDRRRSTGGSQGLVKGSRRDGLQGSGSLSAGRPGRIQPRRQRKSGLRAFDLALGQAEQAQVVLGRG